MAACLGASLGSASPAAASSVRPRQPQQPTLLLPPRAPCCTCPPTAALPSTSGRLQPEQSSQGEGAAAAGALACLHRARAFGLLPTGSREARSPRRTATIMSAGAAGSLGSSSGSSGKPVSSPVGKLLVGVAVAYITLMVLVPFANVFYQAFHKGFGVFIECLMDPDFLHAIKLTLMLAGVAVPVNVLFGLVAAINITRNEFPGKVLLLSLLDLPFSISPVVTGLMLTLLYGRNGWFGPMLQQAGISVVFAFTGMALATMFVTLPFVVRELIPILETMDLSEEEAARTLGANDWQVFWNVTLPNIRWALLYGTILTNARAMGEFGAVSVISGNILGKTQTLTLFVESAYKEYHTEAAFAAAVLLSTLALMTLFIKDKVEAAAAAETQK